jgi:hypothetical protein
MLHILNLQAQAVCWCVFCYGFASFLQSLTAQNVLWTGRSCLHARPHCSSVELLIKFRRHFVMFGLLQNMSKMSRFAPILFCVHFGFSLHIYKYFYVFSMYSEIVVRKTPWIFVLLLLQQSDILAVDKSVIESVISRTTWVSLFRPLREKKSFTTGITSVEAFTLQSALNSVCFLVKGRESWTHTCPFSTQGTGLADSRRTIKTHSDLNRSPSSKKNCITTWVTRCTFSIMLVLVKQCELKNSL